MNALTERTIAMTWRRAGTQRTASDVSAWTGTQGMVSIATTTTSAYLHQPATPMLCAKTRTGASCALAQQGLQATASPVPTRTNAGWEQITATRALHVLTRRGASRVCVWTVMKGAALLVKTLTSAQRTQTTAMPMQCARTRMGASCALAKKGL